MCPEYFELCGARPGTLSLGSLRAFEKARPKLFYLRHARAEMLSLQVEKRKPPVVKWKWFGDRTPNTGGER